MHVVICVCVVCTLRSRNFTQFVANPNNLIKTVTFKRFGRTNYLCLTFYALALSFTGRLQRKEVLSLAKIS